MCNLSFHKEWALLITAVILLVGGMFAPFGFWGKWSLYVAAYLCCASEVIVTSLHNLRRAEVFDENFLMTLATLGAFALGEYPEGISVMLFYQIGEKLQQRAAGQARRKVTALLDLRPTFARCLENGREISCKPEQVAVGQLVRVRAGERLPLDGVIVAGAGLLDTSTLTGEARPVLVNPGKTVWAGSISIDTTLDIRTTKTYQNSAVAQILELTEHAAQQKSSTEKLITRFARIYTPVVVGLAICVATLPPLLTGASWYTWGYRALVFLVISCPCALVLSVPLGFFGGIGGAARHGILVKGSSFLELLTRIGTLCLDKTGTLTQGVFVVEQVVPGPGITREALLQLAAIAELHSNHPIANAILKEAGSTQSPGKDYREIAGEGTTCTYRDRLLVVGNERLLERAGITDLPAVCGTVVYVGYNGAYQGYLELGDPLKQTSKQTVQVLQNGFARQIALVSGDNPTAVQRTAQTLGITHYYGGLLPADKVKKIEDFIAQSPAHTSTVFVGDGMNDAPVLKRADVGIAMGGTDAALEAADVVLMGYEPIHLVTGVQLARFTLRIIRQNIWFALGIKVLILGLGVAGLAHMWLAVFADVGVSLLAVLNSLRPLYYNGNSR